MNSMNYAEEDEIVVLDGGEVGVNRQKKKKFGGWNSYFHIHQERNDPQQNCSEMHLHYLKEEDGGHTMLNFEILVTVVGA